MRSGAPGILVRLLVRLYGASLLLLPAALRREHGASMEALFSRLAADAHALHGAFAALVVFARSSADVVETAIRVRRAARHRTFETDTASPSIRRSAPMDTLLLDVRQAVRALARRPALSFLAVVTFALGIGANTAIFSVVRGVLLRELPYAAPDRVVRLQGTRAGRPNVQGTLSYPNLRDVADRARSFQSVAAYDEWHPALTGAGEPALIDAALVNVDFFGVLGVRPYAGRFFLPEEDVDGQDRVVVLSHGLWRSRFGGDPSILGTTVSLNGNAHEVVGIAPPDFEDPRLGGVRWGVPQIWRPLGFLGLSDTLGPSRGSSSFVAVARLRPDVSVDVANAELAAISRALEAEYPEQNEGVGMTALTLRESIVGNVRGSLLLLLGAVGFVLAIAAANVGNLLLGRATERRHEVALRFALGASRMRIVRLILAETLVLALIGGIAGTLLAALGTGALVQLGAQFVPRGANVSLDAAVLAFAFAVTALTGVVCGLLPALLATASDLRESMGDSSRGGSQTRRAARLRRTLVVAEVALALMLLVGAALLGRSLFRLMRVDVGIDTSSLLTFDIAPSVARYEDNLAVATLHETLETRLSALTGVRALATTNIVPLSGGFDCNTVTVPGRAEVDAADRVCPEVRTVTPSYFDAVGLDRRAGRLLEASDRAGAPPVAVVGAALARTLFGGEEAVGRRLQVVDTVVEIVGVVDDVKHLRLEDPAPPALYLARAQEIVGWHPRQITFMLRTEGDPYAVAPAARALVHEVDPLLPIANVRTLTELVQRSTAPPRFRTLLLGLFAALALVLAAIGIYGVVSYSVVQRTRELAIRMAIGARTDEVRRMVLRQGLAPVILGIGIGLFGALAGSRLLAAVLFEVDATDPLIFAAVPVLLLGVAAMAALLPALRATRVDPMTALRRD